MSYKKTILLFLLLIPAISQAIFRVYTGNVGKNKADFYFDSETAVFVYTNGIDHQVRLLDFVKNNANEFNFKTYYANSYKKMIDRIFIKDFNVVTFNNGSENYQQLTGYAFSKDNKINLDKIFEYKEYSLDEAEFSNIDYLQRDSTKDFYFKVIVSKNQNEKAHIVGVKIFNKKDGRLIQVIDDISECEFHGYVSIKTNESFDFNFYGNNNSFFIVKDQLSGSNNIDKYYAYSYDEKQQKFVKLNLYGNDFGIDDEDKFAYSYKYCPGKKEDEVISLKNNFKYLENNRYKHVETECLYKEVGTIVVRSNLWVFTKQRECTPKELSNCRKFVNDHNED